MTIESPDQIKEYYQQHQVASKYIHKRFTEPLNVIEHQRQVAILNHIIKKRKCQNILEFAPGPARLTAQLDAENGTSIDSSESMLTIARARMQQANKKWNFVQGDILHMKLKPTHDLVFCIRFLLHFKEPERKKIYSQARSALSNQGYFAFEAMNKKVVLPLRKLLGMKKYIVYDKLYTKKELIEEVEKNGFRVVKLYPILNHFWLQTLLSRPFKLMKLQRIAVKMIKRMEKYPSNNPYEWMVLCQKK